MLRLERREGGARLARKMAVVPHQSWRGDPDVRERVGLGVSGTPACSKLVAAPAANRLGLGRVLDPAVEDFS